VRAAEIIAAEIRGYCVFEIASKTMVVTAFFAYPVKTRYYRFTVDVYWILVTKL